MNYNNCGPIEGGSRQLKTKETNNALTFPAINESELFTEDELKIVNKIPILKASEASKTTDLQKIITKINRDNKRNCKDWQENIRILLVSSNMSPIECAELVGISYNQLLTVAKQQKKEGDTELWNLIQESKAAYAEHVMLHPEIYKGNSNMAIFMARSQAGWTDQTVNEFGVPSDQELERIRSARQELMDEYQKLEHAYKVGSVNPTTELKVTA